METVSQSRRKFITALVLLLAGVPLLWRYLTPGSQQRRPLLARVAKAEIPPEGALVYREARAALMHANGEYYALSLACTHLGCTLNVTSEFFSCPCHGSRFDLRGNVLQGPADRPLQRLRVEEHGEMVEVLAA